MAAKKRTSAKGSSRKRSSAKRTSARKGTARKATSRRRTRAASKTKTLKRTARKGLRAARGGIDTVRQAGEKTWKALKSTTAHVVEGVKDRFGDDSDRARTHP